MSRQADGQTSPLKRSGHWKSLVSPGTTQIPELPSLLEVQSGDRQQFFQELGYTFWNRELVDRLAMRVRELGPLRWVELAAGTGRLSLELARRGIEMVATDDFSQHSDQVRGSQRVIHYGEWVHRLTARDAVAELAPDAVICAWPPLGSCLVPDLLSGVLEGSRGLQVVICIGEPGGATEAPLHPHELPEEWTLKGWPECESALVGFNDPPGTAYSNSRLLVYQCRDGGQESITAIVRDQVT